MFCENAKMENLFARIITREFYQREPSLVAQELLGKYLVRKIDDSLLIGKILETEAYLGKNDPAAHGFKGQTQRNNVLFGEAGMAYVYSIHRYHCFNIVTETIGIPSGVLVRAIKPIAGIEMMKQLRGVEIGKGFTNGPGKVCQAFDITRKQNGVDVTSSKSSLLITENENIPFDLIEKSERIGISKAKDLLLRYCIKG
jgi:DNA-3-methyladenine glycosylase